MEQKWMIFFALVSARVKIDKYIKDSIVKEIEV